MVSSDRFVCGEKKHSGGKLIKVCIRASGDRVKGILITGDFFTDPELLDELNEKFQKVNISTENVIEFVIKEVKRKELKFIGVEIEDLKEAIARAVSELKSSLKSPESS
jgi:lipoate-protein ligase A